MWRIAGIVSEVVTVASSSDAEESYQRAQPPEKHLI